MVLAIAALSLAHVTEASAKLKKQTIYAFGFSFSFKDSTVYFTDIQQMDDAYVQEKTNFLDNRNNYSYQLHDHMSQKGLGDNTCIIEYALKKKDAEKKYLKLKKRYSKDGKYIIKFIAANEFQFQPIEPDEAELKAASETKEEKKARKAAEKQERKNKKKKAKEGQQA